MSLIRKHAYRRIYKKSKEVYLTLSNNIEVKIAEKIKAKRYRAVRIIVARVAVKSFEDQRLNLFMASILYSSETHR